MPPRQHITLICPQPGGLEPRCINIGKLQTSLGEVKDVILFGHAFTGTDTTSAAYCRGKAHACRLLRKRPNLRSEISIFYNKKVSQEELLLRVNATSLPGMVLRTSSDKILHDFSISSNAVCGYESCHPASHVRISWFNSIVEKNINFIVQSRVGRCEQM